jgi:hypothetical protein
VTDDPERPPPHESSPFVWVWSDRGPYAFLRDPPGLTHAAWLIIGGNLPEPRPRGRSSSLQADPFDIARPFLTGQWRNQPWHISRSTPQDDILTLIDIPAITTAQGRMKP